MEKNVVSDLMCPAFTLLGLAVIPKSLLGRQHKNLQAQLSHLIGA